ncbi:hypothetical protein TNCV_1016731 [Trichonephila clavipes]|uniref:Uncharacterized protein n=1 Tax=Trichonephila clavipes TaxID=2585209 RepID=A0A8X6VY96_TRICX|nr:hypothetical protein TNCV_1016731 [Trichonephila clavipes]
MLGRYARRDAQIKTIATDHLIWPPGMEDTQSTWRQAPFSVFLYTRKLLQHVHRCVNVYFQSSLTSAVQRDICKYSSLEDLIDALPSTFSATIGKPAKPMVC